MNTIVSVDLLESDKINTSKYNSKDISLLNGVNIVRDYGKSNDYIEQVLYDVKDNLLNINYNYFSSVNSSAFVSKDGLITSLDINPVNDLQKLNYKEGQFKLLYNFFRKKVSDGVNNKLFIKEISSDRTELKLGSNNISIGELQVQVQGLKIGRAHV
jgi:hypothetical protein